MCSTPLTVQTAEIDHVIPESLRNNPEQLARVLTDLGRSADFELNSYENWLPICSPCNRKKSDIVWELSPLIQLVLQKAKAKASNAAALAAKTLSRREVDHALSILERAKESNQLSKEQIAAIMPLVAYQRQIREPELIREPVRVTPTYQVGPYEVLVRGESVTTVSAPYGIGGGPTRASSGMRCGACGHQFFSGARCVVCGNMEDG
jgi:hypothetical protein